MNKLNTLLPANATALEKNIEQVTAGMADLSVPIRDLWNPDTCPLALLPWLAWALDVERWQSDWSEPVQRAAIKASWGVHNKMGTAAGMKIALESLGYSSVKITEFANLFYAMAIPRDGSQTHVGTTLAFQFDVFVDNGGAIPSAQGIMKIKDAINTFKNARSHLHRMYYMAAWHNGGNSHNGAILRDGGLILG